MDINHKTIVVTGAASGIGYEIVKQLIPYDTNILAVDIAPELPQRMAQLSGTAQLQIHIADLTTEAGVQSSFDAAVEHFGIPDIYIANAGFAIYSEKTPADWAKLERMVQVNMLAPMVAAATMRDLHADGTEYMMVITASAQSLMPVYGYTAYAATKAALHSFAIGFRDEIKPNGHLMLFYPTSTRTNFFAVADNAPEIFPVQNPDVVAKAAINGILKDSRAVHPHFTTNLIRSSFISWILRSILKPLHRLILKRWQQDKS